MNKFSYTLLLVALVGVVLTLGVVFFLSKKGRPSLDQSPQATPSAEISHPLGPIEEACLLVPNGIDPKDGNVSHRVYMDPESIDTFTYKGRLVSMDVRELESQGSKCKYHAVNLERGREREVVWPVYLPWNFRLSESQSLGRSDTDAQILEQLLGEELTVTVQFEKQAGTYKYFSWKVEVL